MLTIKIHFDEILNEQGKLLPRRITGNSLKFQKSSASCQKSKTGRLTPLCFGFIKVIYYGSI